MAVIMGGGPADCWNEKRFSKAMTSKTHTADEDFGLAGSRELLLDMLLGHKASATLPASRGVVEDVVDPEAVGEHGNQVVEFDAEEDIIFVDIGVDDSEFGWVTGVEERVAGDLEHGCDTGTASNHAKFGSKVGSEDELALGTLDADVIANLEQ